MPSSMRFSSANPPHAVTSRSVKLTEKPSPVSADCAIDVTYRIDSTTLPLTLSIRIPALACPIPMYIACLEIPKNG
jgi:hypothetical protein